MKIISFIEDEEAIEKILKHLGLWEMMARPPPQKLGTLPIFLDKMEYFL